MRLPASRLLVDLPDRLLRAGRTQGAARFLKDLGWIGVSFTAARIVSGLCSILAARLLGPEEYGRVGLAVAAGSLLSTLMLLGMNAAIVRYGAGGPGASSAFGIGARLAGVGFLVTTVALIAGGRRLGELLGLPAAILWSGWAYATAFSGYALAAGILQALGRFAQRGWTEIGLAGLTLAFFGSGLALHRPSFASLVLAYVSALAVVAAATLWPLRSQVLPQPQDGGRRSPMIRYGIYTMGCGVGFFLTSTVQALLLNALLSTRDVGIYAAHTLASVGLAMFVGSLFSTVFFPKASASTDRRRLWRGLWKAWLFALVPSFLAFALAQCVVLVLMGRAVFIPEPRRIALFALGSCVVLMQTSVGQVIGAEGVRGARLGLVMSLAMGGLNLAGSLTLIPRFGIEGAVAAMTVSYAVGLVWLGLVGPRYLHAGTAA